MRAQILAALGAALGLGACGGASQSARRAPLSPQAPVAPVAAGAPRAAESAPAAARSVTYRPCGVDEVRGLVCVPSVAGSAPCPPTSDVHVAHRAWRSSVSWRGGSSPDAEPEPREAAYDPELTRELRAMSRAPEVDAAGCCYSWCTPIEVHANGTGRDALPAPFPSVRAGSRPVGRTLCEEQPEGGTSIPAAAPFEACPAAVSVHGCAACNSDAGVAALDVAATRAARSRKRERVDEPAHACCYTQFEYKFQGGRL